MAGPKLHHYVPQFHLKRFADAKGKLWVWDKLTDRVFRTTARSLAAETNFYYLHEFEAAGHDPLTMEKQLSGLETEASIITGQWIEWLRAAAPGDKIPVPDVNRRIITRYLAVQHLRTADSRNLLAAFAEEHYGTAVSAEELAALHAHLMWDLEFVDTFAARLFECIWIFGRNTSATPFQTSDHPIGFKTGDNRMWVKVGFLGEEVYAVFPLAPDIIMYCHPPEGPLRKLIAMDLSLSPVTFTPAMVEHENAGQVFYSSRFVIGSNDDFSFARSFAPSIGTDLYAPKGAEKLDQFGARVPKRP